MKHESHQLQNSCFCMFMCLDSYCVLHTPVPRKFLGLYRFGQDLSDSKSSRLHPRHILVLLSFI